jgi:hypothetical protein
VTAVRGGHAHVAADLRGRCFEAKRRSASAKLDDLSGLQPTVNTRLEPMAVC